MSSIIALCVVSSYDIAKVKKDFTYNFIITNPKEFGEILFQFGMNINKMYEVQENVIHRTITGDIVQGDRYIGDERIDPEWLSCGYASQQAKDKASGSSLLNDLYRMKGQSI